MQMSKYLRVVLLADAVTTAASGVLCVGASGVLETWLKIPASLLFYAGVALLPYAAFVWYLAIQQRVTRAAVWAVIVCNALWAIDSVVLLTTGWISPTTLGYGFVILQALVVATFCELQVAGLRRAPVLSS